MAAVKDAKGGDCFALVDQSIELAGVGGAQHHLQCEPDAICIASAKGELQ